MWSIKDIFEYIKELPESYLGRMLIYSFAIIAIGIVGLIVLIHWIF